MVASGREPAFMPTLQNERLEAEISLTGAELIRLRDASGREWLWSGDPAWWGGRAPLLFPIVGKVPNDRIRVDGVEYPMRQHGIARTAPFEVLENTPTLASLVLRASEATKAQYPFDFELEARYRLEGASLALDVIATNRSTRPMPCSFGFHPALRWPFIEGEAKTDYVVAFAEDEPAPIRRLSGGQLGPELHPTPVEGRILRLRDDLFLEDAIIFDRLNSRSLKLISPSGRSVTFDFPDMPQLGVWSKPGAPFVCIEPWQGYAAPQGFDGELAAKPGGVVIAPGGSRTFSMTMSF